jgi:hypothetical protein
MKFSLDLITFFSFGLKIMKQQNYIKGFQRLFLKIEQRGPWLKRVRSGHTQTNKQTPILIYKCCFIFISAFSI